MKKIIATICFALMLAGPASVMAGEKEAAKNIIEMSASHQLTRAERTVLENRVKEIRDMNLNSLSSAEKEELWGELMAIKDKLSEPFTGIYLSAGAIIIILLVLLIIT
jgi:hypothetical protein